MNSSIARFFAEFGHNIEECGRTRKSNYVTLMLKNSDYLTLYLGVEPTDVVVNARYNNAAHTVELFYDHNAVPNETGFLDPDTLSDVDAFISRVSRSII